MPGEDEGSQPVSKPFYSVEEAESILGKDVVEKIVKDGSLRQFRDVGRIFFKTEDVEAKRAELSLAGSKPIPENPPDDGLQELPEHPNPGETEELLNEIHPDDEIDVPQYTPELQEFQYEALNRDGAQITSSILAESREQAVTQVRSLGYFPTRVLLKKRRFPGTIVLGQRSDVVISTGTIALVLFFVLVVENLILLFRYWLH